jgi:uncharacterized repeat protein (TIGR03803 family)
MLSIPFPVRVGRYLTFVSIGAAALLCGQGFASSAAASDYNVLYAFCAKADCADGSQPSSGLLKDAAGNLYGTTETGGANDAGTVYRLSPHGSGYNEDVLYSFCAQANCSDGKLPNDAALIVDEAGALYGLTSTGANGPVAYKLSPGRDRNKSWQLTVLHTFCDAQNGPCADGDAPEGPLSYAGSDSGAPYDGKSPLYGTTELGGAYAWGTVYSLTPSGSGWQENVLYHFCALGGSCADGESPEGNLIVGDGVLTGITNFGGAHDPGGTVFQLTQKHGGWTEKVLHNFCAEEPNCLDGRYPVGGIVAGSTGALYGALSAGGANGPYGGGTYSLIPHNGHWKYKLLHSFCGSTDCPNGAEPEANIVLGNTGTIYGTTFDGGIGRMGVVYAVSGERARVLHRFCSESGCADGGQPSGALITDGSGKLYGTASIFGAHGGSHSGGVVFALTP